MEKPNPMTPRPEGETMNDPIQVGGGFSTCSNCGEEYHNSISHDCPPASAPGGEDVSESVFAALGHLSGTASAFGRGNATFENVESAAQGALTEIAAAVRRAAEQMAERKDAAYLERNRVVAALARCFPSGIKRTAIPGWSEDWHGCVYIDLPSGQASWHYHDSHAHLFAGLPPYAGEWDGHTTEEKYRRLAALPASLVRAVEQGRREAEAGLVARIQALDGAAIDRFWAVYHDIHNPGASHVRMAILAALADDEGRGKA